MNLLRIDTKNILRMPHAVAAALLVALPLAALPLAAQTPLAARLTAPIDNTTRATLAHSRPPLADPARDLGAVSPSLPLEGMSIVFSRTPQQTAALEALLAAQQNRSSPQYHQWLTPEQFAAQFGVADSDLAAVSTWLQQQGFSVSGIARSRNRIGFSGTAAQVEAAFGAPLHNFTAPDGSMRFAPAADISVPAALGSAVLAVENLSSFRLQPRLKLAPQQAGAQVSGVSPLFTSAQSGSHFLAPGDVAVMYDVKAAYSAGYTGTGQSIAIVGQTQVLLSDIAAFQSAAGVTAKAPIPVLVPNTGTAYISLGDEAESDLDLEYSSSMAPGAQVYFLYTGNFSNSGVLQAIQYAVEQDTAPIVSSSYGGCEIGFGAGEISVLDGYFQQGNAQGQTFLSSSGDSGSTDCFGEYAAGNAGNYQLAIDYPASSPYVTAMGGSEIPVASSAASNSTYFTAASGSDVLTSLKSYVPEQVWNDDAASGANGPASGGGGLSIYETRPSWQVGTFGGVAFPTGTSRLIPDISLVASNYSAPLLFCTSDTSAYNKGQVGSCTSGFRDSSTQDLTAAGGTSFDAPIFAGLLALINQARQPAGQGNINPTLYSLAGSAGTYASAFHDIATGGNQCLTGLANCGTGAEVTSYPAVTGYDPASGLGSIDLFNLLTAWPATATAALPATTTTVSASSTTFNLGASTTITVNVAQTSGTGTVPASSVALTIDGTAVTTLTLNAGTATYAYTPATGGTHVILAQYGGDTTHAASHGSVTVTANEVTLTGSSVTIVNGSSGTSTLTLTPVGSYTGTVNLALIGYTGNLTNFCINGGGTLTIKTPGAAVSEPLLLYTSATTCAAQSLTPFAKAGSGKLALPLGKHAAMQPAPAFPGKPNAWQKAPAAAALACLLLTLGFRRRKLARTGLALGFVLMLSLTGMGLTGCSNGAASTVATTTTASNPNNTIPGTYTLQIGAQDAVTGFAVAQATITVTVQ